MPIKYKSIRCPIESYNKIKEKAKSMEDRWKKLTGQKRRIKIARLINLISSKKIFVEDDELKYIVTKTKIR